MIRKMIGKWFGNICMMVSMFLSNEFTLPALFMNIWYTACLCTKNKERKKWERGGGDKKGIHLKNVFLYIVHFFFFIMKIKFNSLIFYWKFAKRINSQSSLCRTFKASTSLPWSSVGNRWEYCSLRSSVRFIDWRQKCQKPGI